MDGTRPDQGGSPRKRRRLLKVLLWTLCVLLIVTGITAYMLYRSAGTRPQWYTQPDPATTAQPAREGENKLIEIQTWAGARYAWEYAHNTGRQPRVREPDPRLRVTFTEAEINAMLQKWFMIYGQENVGGKRVMDLIGEPMVHLTSDGITLAATVPQADSRVLSIELRPEVLGDGQLHLQLLAIRSGKLPLPEFVWSRLRDSLLADLNRQLPGLAREAALDRGGGANGQFVAALSIAQATDILQHHPTTNALFLPIISEGKALPVQVESVELGEGTLTLTVQTMPLEQRRELLSGLRK